MTPKTSEDLGSPSDRDLSTLSNYTEIRTTHIDLAWNIDWDRQLISGVAKLKFEALVDVREIVLDTSYLAIENVKIGDFDADYVLDPRVETMGQALHIKCAPPLKAGQFAVVEVKYSTTKDCTAVGWLTPVQTKSGKYPYLYSQCQAIHARSLLPCQDTPAIKATYSAKVTSILPALMSGLRISPPSEEVLEPGKEREYVYDQPVPIPSYLIAIASGEVVYKPFKNLEGRQWRSGVWAEPATMGDAFWEFSEDVAQFVATAEDLTSKYLFGVYDILILPDSFPYGGMENSCLTFATPTTISHDRSQVDLFAHEISHSWFGNGIGCASWSHFWLNEGWTTYCERLIMAKVYGEPTRQLSYIIGRKALQDSLAQMKDEPRFQKLVVDYKEHEDPDDAFSSVPYDKGAHFLLYLERLLGGTEVFIPYMKSYVNTFSGHSITTNQWRSHLFDYFGGLPDGSEYVRKLGKVDWDEWLYGTGLDICVEITYDDSLSKPCLDLADRWDAARSDKKLEHFSPKDVESFSSTQKVVFLEKLETLDPFSPEVVASMDKLYGLGKTDNSEIKLRFYELALNSGPEYAEQAAVWVSTAGRMKYCRPIYRLLNKQTPKLAKKTFLDHASFYHPIARKMIAKDLGVKVE